MLKKLNKIKIDLMKSNKVNKSIENTFKINIINDVLTEVKNTAVKKKIVDINTLSDSEIIKVIEKVMKQLDKEIEGLKTANRDTSKPEVQKEFLATFVPQKADEKETEDFVLSLVQEGKALPEIMKEAKNFSDKFDLSLVSKIAKEKLKK